MGGTQVRELDDCTVLIQGDVLETLEGSALDGYFDACLTDPPYGLKFMGKRWDHGVPGEAVWREVLRVLKPGGMLLAFGGTRTHHRLMVAIEDAGFEIRDCLMWVYGTGFPKSHDISKGIDKAAGAEREVVGSKMGQPGYSLVEARSGSEEIFGDGLGGKGDPAAECAITAPATPAAHRWQGYGTALKPAWEPVILAMRPLDSTFAQNALEHGVAGLWIDGGRIETEDNLDGGAYAKHGGRKVSPSLRQGSGMNVEGKTVDRDFEQPPGRWPANLLLGHSPDCTETCSPDCAVRLLDEQSGESKDGIAVQRHGGGRRIGRTVYSGSNDGGSPPDQGYGGSGGASRFFYTAKASTAERNRGVDHIETVSIQFSAWEDGGQPVEVVLQVDTAPSPPRVITVSTTPQNDAREWSMFLFGNENTAPSLLDFASTTETATSSTMKSKTLSWLISRLTNESTRDANCALGSGGSPAGSAENSSQSTVTIGISREEDTPCTTAAVPATFASWLETSKGGGKLAVTHLGNGSRHPTHKPLALTAYLAKLLLPPERETPRRILVPFCGSGSEIIGAFMAGWDEAVGVELEQEYIEIAERRIAYWLTEED